MYKEYKLPHISQDYRIKQSLLPMPMEGRKTTNMKLYPALEAQLKCMFASQGTPSTRFTIAHKMVNTIVPD